MKEDNIYLFFNAIARSYCWSGSSRRNAHEERFSHFVCKTPTPLKAVGRKSGNDWKRHENILKPRLFISCASWKRTWRNFTLITVYGSVSEIRKRRYPEENPNILVRLVPLLTSRAVLSTFALRWNRNQNQYWVLASRLITQSVKLICVWNRLFCVFRQRSLHYLRNRRHRNDAM